MRRSLLILHAIVLLEQFIQGNGTDKIPRRLSGTSSSGSDIEDLYPKADLNRDILAHDEVEFNVDELRTTWCVPCRMMTSFTDITDIKEYVGDNVLKADVDECKGTEKPLGRASLPAFTLYRNKLLTEKLAESTKYEKGCGSEDGHYINLAPFVNKCQCTYVNATLCHPYEEQSGEYAMHADFDPQLIVSIFFTQRANIHSLVIKGSAWNGPRTIKLFINLPNILTSKNIENDEATQKIELELKNLKGDPVNLIYDKFQNVSNLQIFVEDIQQKDDGFTIINDLVIMGVPAAAAAQI